MAAFTWTLPAFENECCDDMPLYVHKKVSEDIQLDIDFTARMFPPITVINSVDDESTGIYQSDASFVGNVVTLSLAGGNADTCVRLKVVVVDSDTNVVRALGWVFIE